MAVVFAVGFLMRPLVGWLLGAPAIALAPGYSSIGL
ncbi:hypothetical protein SAMN04489733_0872 [Amycolatopsis keratiniphila]|nr:hypothetical protein SAMN04489733_0872 [Amycolatopsis keratiniphila]